MPGLGPLIPAWLDAWLALAAVAAAVAGLRARIVVGLAAAPAFRWIVGPALHPVFAAQPLAVRATIMLAVGLMAVQAVLTLLFGRHAAGHFTGVMLVRLFDWLLLGPLRGLGRLARGLMALW